MPSSFFSHFGPVYQEHLNIIGPSRLDWIFELGQDFICVLVVEAMR